MAKLNDDKDEKIKRLTLEVKNLRAKVVEYQNHRRKCIREHGNQDQLARGGLNVKKEEPRDDLRPSTSIKREERYSHRNTDEYFEEEEDIVVIPS